MVRKLIQLVPIDGTRWRNEFVNGHENHGVGVHYGIAPGRVMAPRRELPNIARVGGLLGRPRGVLALFFIKREMKTHYDVDNSSNPARRVTVKGVAV